MPLKSFIGLISATQQEACVVNLRKSKAENFYTGKIGNKNIILVVSGIGKTNASHAATLLIERFSPALIINFGIGGAYPASGLNIGDIAIADREIYGDEGLRLKDGFHTADLIGIPFVKKGRKKYFNEFPLDRNLRRKALKHFKLETCSLKLAANVKSGAFVTVSASTGTGKMANDLEKRFNAICENMEGAAIAHICAMYNIPMLEIRGISNVVEDRNRGKWDIKTASENCRKAILEFLKI